MQCGHISWARAMSLLRTLLILDYLSENTYIVSGAEDNSVRVWNAEAHKLDKLAGHSVNDKGWICAANGELMLWVPEQHMRKNRDMSLHCIFVNDEGPIVIDWDKLFHGEQWIAIRS